MRPRPESASASPRGCSRCRTVSMNTTRKCPGCSWAEGALNLLLVGLPTARHRARARDRGRGSACAPQRPVRSYPDCAGTLGAHAPDDARRKGGALQRHHHRDLSQGQGPCGIPPTAALPFVQSGEVVRSTDSVDRGRSLALPGQELLADVFADRPFERPLGSETCRVANASTSAEAARKPRLSGSSACHCGRPTEGTG